MNDFFLYSLEAYDRNANFGQEVLPDAFNMVLPDEANYRDIHSESPVPKVTEEYVTTYMSLFNQNLKDNVIGMYTGKFLHSVRYSRTDSTFICGRVSAEYSKKVVYKVDIKLDGHGVIQECQCQCASGTGPSAHCKHVGLVYYALTKVKQGIVTKETCTQQLQTFHQAKKYNGSPVKMQNIKGNSSGMADLKDFDPRPQELRNMPEYPDKFRSVWLNSSAPECAIRQLYGPANVYGVVNDHDYNNEHPEDMFLASLKIRDITETDVADVEMRTRGQNMNKQWKEERLLRLQASSFGRICKRTEKTNHGQLAWSLTEYKDISSDAINHGRKYEEVAREAYCTKMKTSVEESGIVVCLGTPFLGCSPDGLVGEDGIVEIKCPFTAREKMIIPDTVPYLQWSANETMVLKESHDYYYQVMGTLLCTNRKWCDFVVWTFKDTTVIRIYRDEQFMLTMKLKLKDFFDKYFRQVLLQKHLYKQSHTFLTVSERF